MRILSIRRCDIWIPRPAGKTGFTLIELLVVIFIISLTTALIMPSLWDTGERALKSEAKRIGNTLRYIYDEAAARKQTYVFKIDLETDSWSFESRHESRSFKLKDDVMFRDVVIPSVGEVSYGKVAMKFGPLGPEEPVTLHLMKDKAEYTVKFNPLNGRAKIYEGYIL